MRGWGSEICRPINRKLLKGCIRPPGDRCRSSQLTTTDPVTLLMHASMPLLLTLTFSLCVQVKCDKRFPCSRCVRLEVACCSQIRGRGRPPKAIPSPFLGLVCGPQTVEDSASALGAAAVKMEAGGLMDSARARLVM